jgi:AAA domain
VVESSPSGGWHVAYRCTEPVSGNLKLAQRREELDGPAEVVRFGKAYQPRTDREGRWHLVLTMIETRGEGGLFLCAPTPGYQLLQGAFTDLPVLTPRERDVLLRCAWALNTLLPEPLDPQPVEPPPRATIEGLRPGDDFNRRADLGALLRHHGWSLTQDGANQHWCRPGKSHATSATRKDGVLYVFSSNAAPFEPNRAYSPFAAYALLEHHGDYQAAAAELRRCGYGSQPHAPDEVNLDGLVSQKKDVPLLSFDLQSFAETPEREIDWLWPGVIPTGMLSLIGGKQGLGKSFLICDLAARVSTGRPMPDGTERAPGNVLLLAREDDASCVLLPRLRAANADLKRVCWSVFANPKTGSSIDMTAHIRLLVEATTAHAFDLIVVDTFAAFAPAGTDANAAQDVRMLLDALTHLARQTKAAVVVVAHLRKNGQGDGDPMDAIAGSTQMTAGVRVAALLDKGLRENERWFRVVKSNLGKFDENGWTWRFTWPDPFTEGASEMPRIQWKEAGDEYEGLAHGTAEAALDIDLVKSELLKQLGKGPRSLRTVSEMVGAAVRKDSPRCRKADIDQAIQSVLMSNKGLAEQWEGPRGMKMVGPPGGRGEEDPYDKALRLAKEDPEQTVNELRARAGCKRETAMQALRAVRNQTP